MLVKAEGKVSGACTSISLTADSSHFFAGTSKATIYWCNAGDISPELRNTCHSDRINDVAFPAGYSDLFATCSTNDIHIPFRSVSGTPRPDKSFLESKFQASSATVLSSTQMERVSSPDGTTARSEPSYHSLANSFMPSMMPTTMA